MSLKAKLVSTIAAVCMVICLLSVGIWAANRGVVNIGGSVSFDISDVNVRVTGTVKQGLTAAGYADLDVTFDASDDGELEDDITVAIEEWAIGAIKFEKTEGSTVLQDIIIEITVENLSEEKTVSVSLVADAEKENPDAEDDVTLAVTKGGAVYADASLAVADDAVGSGSDFVKYEITISTTKTANESVTGSNFNYVLTAQNA